MRFSMIPTLINTRLFKNSHIVSSVRKYSNRETKVVWKILKEVNVYFWYIKYSLKITLKVDPLFYNILVFYDNLGLTKKTILQIFRFSFVRVNRWLIWRCVLLVLFSLGVGSIQFLLVTYIKSLSLPHGLETCVSNDSLLNWIKLINEVSKVRS